MEKRARVAAGALLAFLLGASPHRQQQPDLGIAVFPSDNPWNWDISGLAVHPGSAVYINTIGAGTPLREDYAFHYSVVLDAQSNVDVAFNQFEDESDPGPGFGSPLDGTLSTGSKGSYPIPSTAQIEPGGDAHVLVIDKDNALLYETYATSGGPPWTAGCGAVFNLNSNAVRPEGWTSGDAAGLPIFPGLIRYEEVAAGQINHALRFTCSPTQDRHVYPARHHAGTANVNDPPLGLRVRLKASKDISGYTGAARVILEALKKHGLILADNGSDWYISTTIDTRWASTNITQIRDMVGSDFEVVVSVDAAGAPILPVTGGGTGPAPPPVPVSGGGGGGGGGCGLSGVELLLLGILFRTELRIRRR
jgi:hypothetical protein